MEVLPVIRGRWPAAARTVARVAGHAAEALQIESALASADLESVALGSALSLDALARLPVARQRLVLRAWLRQLGLPVPSERTLAALRHDMLEAADDRLPRVNWPGVSVHRYRRYLHALGQAEEAATIAEGNWPVGSAFDLGSLGRLTLRPATGKGLRRDGLPPVLRVDSRTGGEVFRPAGSEHRRPLRKWLQERGILPWRREQLPLIRAGDEVAAIGDIALWRVVRGRAGRALLADRVGGTSGADGERGDDALRGGRQGAVPIDCPPVVLLLRRWLP